MRSTITDSVIILARTDYGERDRILTLLSAKHGKLRAIAKGVRAAKSKLAGGIELFAENQLVMMEGKSELYTVISSQMKRYFGGISKDLDRSMYAYECMKNINKLAPDGAGADYYDALLRLFAALGNDRIHLGVIKIWYGLKLLDSMGASPNLKTDSAGRTLSLDSTFIYDFDRHCFSSAKDGPYRPEHVKVLRHLYAARNPKIINGLNDKLIDSTERLVNMIAANQTT